MGSITYKKGAATKLSGNFDSTEFDCHGSGCCSSTLVDPVLVQHLQKIREHFNTPITVTSGYRCIQHNSNIGSGTGSQHVKGCAADIVVSGVAPAAVAKYCESIGILGIGLYETKSDGYFVHIDTRTVKAFWYGQAQKYRSTFGGASSTVGTTINNTSTSTNCNQFILARGNTGDSVRELQTNLMKLGYSCGGSGADGSYGANTEAAVRLFQKEYGGISADGIAGYKTLTAVKEAVSAKAFRIKVIASVLNVRSGAGTSYAIVSTIRKNSTQLVFGESNGWGKLHSPAGYISMQYAQKI